MSGTNWLSSSAIWSFSSSLRRFRRRICNSSRFGSGQALDDIVEIAMLDLQGLDFPADEPGLFVRELHHCPHLLRPFIFQL
jgi:hypothetical protein